MQKKGKLMIQITSSLEENKQKFQELFRDCIDIKMVSMKIGRDGQVACMAAYIEVTGGSVIFERSLVGQLLNSFSQASPEEIYGRLENNALGLSDTTPYTGIEEAAQGLLTGDVILFFDGWDKAIKVPDKGYPQMGITEAESEKVIRGSNEGFCDSIKANTALIRKRIRSPKVKVREKILGEKSQTNVDLVYMEDLVYPSLLEEIERRLESFAIDGILDSGMLEQLSEKNWYSPFPQFQTTQRPDRAAMAVLEGRVVLLSDNSPVALILPTNYNSFIQTSDDYYSRWEIASIERVLRYLASFFAMALPGLYLA
ncbi:MAG: spore germination protein, partial [Lachnospiraceae bacterium]|nr:spore germination protein [Lachnospiraceae bacterium]